jgi:hypothetical protein
MRIISVNPGYSVRDVQDNCGFELLQSTPDNRDRAADARRTEDPEGRGRPASVCHRSVISKVTAVRLDRREVLEQLVRLGIRGFSPLKHACREFEAYWENMLMGKKEGCFFILPNDKAQDF